MAPWPLLLGFRPCFWLLLLLLCSEVSLAVSELIRNEEVNDGVGFIECPPGQHVDKGSCKSCSGDTYMDHRNSETACDTCKVQCGIKEELDGDYTSCSRNRCRCIEGYCKNRDHPEGCYLCSSGNPTDEVSGNATNPGPAGTMESGGHDPVTRTPDPVNTTGPQREATVTHLLGLTSDPTPTPPGSPENSLPKWLVPVVSVLLVFAVLGTVYFLYTRRDQLCDWVRRFWVRRFCFQDQKQPQGQVHHVGCSDPRNSFEMRTVSVDTRNGQCIAEETHNLMPGGHSDSAPDSAIPVMLEVMPQSGPPETPVPDQVTMEQEPGCTSVASSL